MNDLGQLLLLWKEFRECGCEYVLATVVAVEGSGYRKPGARMIVGEDGRRCGTISGGCLEGDVAKKAFWHTKHGPVVRRYATTGDDGEVPFGMGCGGVVHLLLERSCTADEVLEQLNLHFHARRPLTIATVLEGRFLGRRGYSGFERTADFSPVDGHSNDCEAELRRMLIALAERGMDDQRSFSLSSAVAQEPVKIRVEWSPARPGLFLFGAGDDAIPVVRQASQLGWYVAVCDGRRNLVTRSRFPTAEDVFSADGDPWFLQDMRQTDSAVVMTHSMEQDTNALRALLAQDSAYIGVLGPRRRTFEILRAVAVESRVPEGEVVQTTEAWMVKLHAPMGLDLGGDTPADIALAVISEIQQTLYQRSGLPLRQVRSSLPLESETRAQAAILSRY